MTDNIIEVTIHITLIGEFHDAITGEACLILKVEYPSRPVEFLVSLWGDEE